MPGNMLADAKYEVEPSVVTRIAAFLQDQVNYGSLASQNIPLEGGLSTLTKKYEWAKKDPETGIGFEMDVVTPPDSHATLEEKSVKTPIVYSNATFTYNQWREQGMSLYSLQQRLADHIAEMAVRQDLIAYIGDSKHSINPLGTATPGTEVTTQLDVSTTALAASTFSAT